MKYSRLSDVFTKLEGTSSRLDMIAILVDLFRSASPDILDKVVYLTQGELFPPYVGMHLGLAEKMVIKALSKVSGFSEDEIERHLIDTGDLGDSAEVFIGKKRQMALFHSELTIERVYDNFVKIATVSGKGSNDMKTRLLQDLLHDAEPIEARYIVRTVLGRLRLGIADMTILDAIATAFATKEDRPELEHAFNRHPALGEIAVIMATSGLEDIRKIRITPGIPVKVMLAERLPSMREILARMGGRAALDYKYDGIRVQAHISEDGTKLYSRRMEDMTPQFPDIAQALTHAFKGRNAIVEGECVPVDVNTGEMLPFQAVSHRRGRKYDLDKTIEEFPVTLFLFDALYVDWEDITERPYLERRKVLENIMEETDKVRMSTMIITSDLKEAEEFFLQALADGCEGVIAKNLSEEGIYRAGSRGFLWIKYKRDYKSEMTDTVDLVVVGAYAGKGRRAGKFGTLLMAAYNPDRDRFETVCKLGAGFTDEFMEGLSVSFKGILREERDPRVDAKMDADYWLEPEMVLEVIGAEISHSPVHTCAFNVLREGAGLAVRFPRFTGRIREDKGPEDATTTTEIISMYKSQRKTM